MSTRYCDALATRELLGMVRDAAVAAPSPAVLAAVGVLTEALHHGQALRACLELQGLAPRDAAPFDRELCAAAISVGSALWHVETGTDATPALDAAQADLHKALDAHRAAAS